MTAASHMRATACLVLLLMHSLSLAAEPPPANTSAAAVIAALHKLDATDIDREWYFTMALLEDGEQRVIHSDPHQGKYHKRSLVLVDGKSPGEKRLHAFREAEKKRIDELQREEQPYTHLVNPPTLRLVERSAEVSRFSFFPRVRAMADSEGEIAGLLLLNNQTREIEKIEIYNTAPLSPAFSVTVESYRLSFIFMQEQGAQLLQQMESRARGKAGFLKAFDQQVVVDFSDYRRDIATQQQ